jgi:predicted metal-dependent HD superfamily phosphohydrolase/ligand-binding SRPBCC domain-containing protein
MPSIDLSCAISAPRSRVFDLARSIDLHRESTAQTRETAIGGVTSGLIALGESVTWRARHFGIWQTLTSQITGFDAPAHFRDSMIRGAFRRFDHDHFFTEADGVTTMRDVFTFISPYGIVGRAIDRLVLTRHMRHLLAQRQAVIKAVAESHDWQRYLTAPADATGNGMIRSWAEVDAIGPLRLSPAQQRARTDAYATPPRAYHSLAHVFAVVVQWHEVARRLGWQRPRETFCAVLFHDAIYRAGATDNESRSAAFARSVLGGVPELDLAEVERLIILTASHGKLAPAQVDRDTALFLDCDMAILGAAPAVYAAYEQNIRIEYAHVPKPLFRRGRQRFLARLLAEPRIFLSEDFHQRLDAPARENVRAALAAMH